jgi:hypothetical protein
LAARGGSARLRAAARFVRRRQIRERRWAPPERHSAPAFPVAVRYVLMAAARLFRRRAAAGEVVAWFALARRQAPFSPVADRWAEHRSKAQSLPEALVCRQSLAAAKALRSARSSAAAWARRWAPPVASAAEVAEVALRSGQTAALHASEEAAAGEAARPDAGAAGARHAGAAEAVEEPRVAGVVEEVAQLGAAAAVLQPAAPGGRAQPPSAGLSFRLQAARLAPQPAARFARAREGLRIAAP